MIDLAFTYIQGEELEVNETADPTPFVVNAKTETNAVIFGTSYSYQF